MRAIAEDVASRDPATSDPKSGPSSRGPRLPPAPREAEEGVTLVEYALMLAFLSMGCVVAISALRTAVTATYQTVCTALH